MESKLTVELKVEVCGAVRKLRISPASRLTLREILEAEDVPAITGCRGNGTCGQCVVKVLGQGFRLACRLVPATDMHVRLVNIAAPTVWRDEAADGAEGKTREEREGVGSPLGLAVDLGTTHISIALWDLGAGRRLRKMVGLNPQSRYGADVVTRLAAAAHSDKIACALSSLPLEAIRGALGQICNPSDVKRVAFVGNTAMLALLARVEPGVLLDPAAWDKPLECRADRRRCAETLGIDPDADVEIVQPVAGFVGSDLLAGVVATGLAEDRTGCARRPASPTVTLGGAATGLAWGSPAMLVDFGTNTEIALWEGRTLLVTSAAGGPAFEGSGIRRGMPAGPGAIHKVVDMVPQTIGGGPPVGICGSGLVDLVACLRSSGTLSRTGRLRNGADAPRSMAEGTPEAAQRCDGGTGSARTPPGPRAEEITIGDASPGFPFALDGRDVDVFQRAKAAVAAGIKALLSRSGLAASDLERICVCGVFGTHLDVRNAQAVGLLPTVPVERVELCGNTALSGCEQILLQIPGHRHAPVGAALRGSVVAGDLRASASILNLAFAADFEELFVESLFIEPFGERRGDPVSVPGLPVSLR